MFHWVLSWVLFAALNGGLLALDWSLRDHSIETQPIPGGLPPAGEATALLSPVALGMACILGAPENWSVGKKFFLSLLQAILATGLLLWARVHYVISFGIDTL